METLLDGARNNAEVNQRFLKIIERNANRLDLLIQDLLTISALESGRMKLNLQTVDVHARWRKRCWATCTPSRRPSTWRWPTTCPYSPSARTRTGWIRCLPTWWDNAIKYGRLNGKVTVNGRKLDDGRLDICSRSNTRLAKKSWYDWPGPPAR